jgi:hypothetical protein
MDEGNGMTFHKGDVIIIPINSIIFPRLAIGPDDDRAITSGEDFQRVAFLNLKGAANLLRDNNTTKVINAANNTSSFHGSTSFLLVLTLPKNLHDTTQSHTHGKNFPIVKRGSVEMGSNGVVTPQNKGGTNEPPKRDAEGRDVDADVLFHEYEPSFFLGSVSLDYDISIA